MKALASLRDELKDRPYQIREDPKDSKNCLLTVNLPSDCQHTSDSITILEKKVRLVLLEPATSKTSPPTFLQMNEMLASRLDRILTEMAFGNSELSSFSPAQTFSVAPCLDGIDHSPKSFAIEADETEEAFYPLPPSSRIPEYNFTLLLIPDPSPYSTIPLLQLLRYNYISIITQMAFALVERLRKLERLTAARTATSAQRRLYTQTLLSAAPAVLRLGALWATVLRSHALGTAAAAGGGSRAVAVRSSSFKGEQAAGGRQSRVHGSGGSGSGGMVGTVTVEEEGVVETRPGAGTGVGGSVEAYQQPGRSKSNDDVASEKFLKRLATVISSFSACIITPEKEKEQATMENGIQDENKQSPPPLLKEGKDMGEDGQRRKNDSKHLPTNKSSLEGRKGYEMCYKPMLDFLNTKQARNGFKRYYSIHGKKEPK